MIKLSSFNTAGTFLTDSDYLIGVRLNAGVYTDWKYPAFMLSFGGQGMQYADKLTAISSHLNS